MTDYDRLNEMFGGVITFNILVAGEEQDALYDPGLLKAMEGMQRFLESRPGIGRTLSIVDYIKQMNVAFNDGDDRFRSLPRTRGKRWPSSFSSAIVRQKMRGTKSAQ